MPYLISIAVAGAVFGGFLFLTGYESRRGVRFFPAFRYRLDTNVARGMFLIRHIDWGAFTAHLTRTSLNTVMHDAAHGALMLVRSTERGLTRAVKALRMRRDSLLPSGGEKRPLTDIVRKEKEG